MIMFARMLGTPTSRRSSTTQQPQRPADPIRMHSAPSGLPCRRKPVPDFLPLPQDNDDDDQLASFLNMPSTRPRPRPLSAAFTARITGPGPLLLSSSPTTAAPASGTSPLLGILTQPALPPKLDSNPLLLVIHQPPPPQSPVSTTSSSSSSSISVRTAYQSQPQDNINNSDDDEEQEHLDDPLIPLTRRDSTSPRFNSLTGSIRRTNNQRPASVASTTPSQRPPSIASSDELPPLMSVLSAPPPPIPGDEDPVETTSPVDATEAQTPKAIQHIPLPELTNDAASADKTAPSAPSISPVHAESNTPATIPSPPPPAISLSAPASPGIPAPSPAPISDLDAPMQLPAGTHAGNPLLIHLSLAPDQQQRPAASSSLLGPPSSSPSSVSVASTRSPWADDEELRSAVEAASTLIFVDPKNSSATAVGGSRDEEASLASASVLPASTFIPPQQQSQPQPQPQSWSGPPGAASGGAPATFHFSNPFLAGATGTIGQNLPGPAHTPFQCTSLFSCERNEKRTARAGPGRRGGRSERD
ncbi:hypothetical protein V8E36_000240 [Tilletia maclaganii]